MAVQGQRQDHLKSYQCGKGGQASGPIAISVNVASIRGLFVVMLYYGTGVSMAIVGSGGWGGSAKNTKTH